MSALTPKLAAVRQRLAAAAARAGRGVELVKLVAVSKTHPPERIREAYAAGQRDFGENYAQELAEKAAALRDLQDLRWHFVGHLQRNKAKFVAPVTHLIHTVDSVELARDLVRRAGGRQLAALIEVNLASEPQKGGVRPEALLALGKELAAVPLLRLEGLMCLPPADQPPRPRFAELRQLRDSLGQALGQPLLELSMGMSGDFEEAIAEGATLVRVGSAIFGERGQPPPVAA